MNNIKFIVVPEAELKALLSDALRAELAKIAQAPENSSPDFEYLTRKQTAKRLQISLVTLSKWTNEGIIKGYRVSRFVRYRSDEVELALTKIRTA